jgi:type I restriction enzyme S subunit
VSWTSRPLAQIADFNLGKMLDQKKNRGQLLPYLANINVRWGKFELNDLREMRFEDHEVDRFQLRHGDIVMCEGGEPGRCAIWKEQVPGMMYQKALHRIRPHSCLDGRFLYYTFLEMGRINAFSGLFTGSTIKHLPKDKLAKLEIRFPSLAEQQHIATTLSAYDDLIENNRRRIALLEEAARQLYKEWFVSFRFPGHEHVEIVDHVPEGWKRYPFPEIVDFKEGPGLRNYQYRDEGVPFLNIRTLVSGDVDLTKTQFLDPNEVETKYRHFLVEENDHVVSSSGTLGRVATVRKCHLPLCLNTSIIRMRPRTRIGVWHLRAYLSHGDFIDQATARATGAAQLNFGPSHLKQMDILIPTDNLAALAERELTPIYEQIKVLHDQNLNLTKARDLLLPKLLSGAITV